MFNDNHILRPWPSYCFNYMHVFNPEIQFYKHYTFLGLQQYTLLDLQQYTSLLLQQYTFLGYSNTLS